MVNAEVVGVNFSVLLDLYVLSQEIFPTIIIRLELLLITKVINAGYLWFGVDSRGTILGRLSRGFHEVETNLDSRFR